MKERHVRLSLADDLQVIAQQGLAYCGKASTSSGEFKVHTD